VRQLYLTDARRTELRAELAWCRDHRISYRIVGDEDLAKLAASPKHEGVVVKVLREDPLELEAWLRTLPPGPCCALWLDGVGNPHNLGAILRAAAHFGSAAVLLPPSSTLTLSGASARVAEGGAESVALVRLGPEPRAVAALDRAGFTLAATVVRGGRDLFLTAPPPRTVYVLGAEVSGMSAELTRACALKVTIPGTGHVESLNVAAACAVLLAEWSRAHRRR
jgi:TrmH RNA methyltransferase